jgi:hypothetical protein
VELARDLRVCVDDFRETVASDARLRRFARTDVRPGILAIYVELFVLLMSFVYASVMVGRNGLNAGVCA